MTDREQWRDRLAGAAVQMLDRLGLDQMVDGEDLADTVQSILLPVVVDIADERAAAELRAAADAGLSPYGMYDRADRIDPP